MRDKKDKERLDALGKRLAAARTSKPAKSPKPEQKHGSEMGKAYRMGIELVIAIAVGGAIGWFLDKWLETSPWLFIIFFFLGVAAGFRNVYKAAQKMGGSPPEVDKK